MLKIHGFIQFPMNDGLLDGEWIRSAVVRKSLHSGCSVGFPAVSPGQFRRFEPELFPEKATALVVVDPTPVCYDE
jgi:hypothetical protein